MPPPLASLIRGHVATPATVFPSLPVQLGYSPCSRQGHATRATTVLSTPTLVLPSNNVAVWCPFCHSPAPAFQSCHLSPESNAGTVKGSSWSTCIDECGDHLSTRGHFCSVVLESAGSKEAPSSTTQVRVANVSGVGRTDVDVLHGQTFVALMESGACAQSEAHLQQLRVKPCGGVPSALVAGCNQPRWQWLQVGECSVPCGAGLQQQVARCVDAAGAWLPDDACPASLPAQPTEIACNTHPCFLAVWSAGPWGECRAPGVRNRAIVCAHMSDLQQVVDDAQCAGQEVPVAQEPCDFAKDTNICSDDGCYQGSCSDDGSHCVCSDGWTGQQCDSRIDCSGLVSDSGECCVGLRGGDKQCCGVGDVLDRMGVCCPAERLDVCRVCGGTATVVDLAGTCGAGQLDAGGLLCHGQVDECGVCGGTGLSCHIHAPARAAFVDATAASTNASTDAPRLLRDANTHALALIASELHVGPADVLVQCSAPHDTQQITVNETDVIVMPLHMQVQFSPVALPQWKQATASTFWLRGALDELIQGASLALGENPQALTADKVRSSRQVCSLFRFECSLVCVPVVLCMLLIMYATAMLM